MRSKLFAIFFGVCLSFVMLALIECGWRYYAHLDPSVLKLRYRLGDGMPADPALSWKMYHALEPSLSRFVDYPNRELDAQMMAEGLDNSGKYPPGFFEVARGERRNWEYTSIVKGAKNKSVYYNVKVHFDKYATRNVPGRPDQATSQYLFAGCSFTFGEGVNDDETTPGYFQKLRPAAQVFNFGIGGESPSDVVYELDQEFDQRYKQIQISDGKFIYLYIDHHIPRVTCPVSCLREENSWIMDHPNFQFNSKTGLTYQGKFRDRAALNAVYRVFAQLTFLHDLSMEWPPLKSESSLGLFVEVVKRMRQLAAEKLGIQKFYFALMPQFSQAASPDLENRLREANINVVDLRDVNAYELLQHKTNIPGDGHPTSLYHEFTARMIDHKIPRETEPPKTDYK